ncbi:hypothetical protein K458DRAFT_467769, partial [Lentithecium fluviatile CBS 122367]
DIFHSIAKRQGRGLLAQKAVSQYFSENLGENPWVAEVRNLVLMALARTQINAWSIASGEDSVHEGKNGYKSITEKYGDLCELNPIEGKVTACLDLGKEHFRKLALKFRVRRATSRRIPHHSDLEVQTPNPTQRGTLQRDTPPAPAITTINYHIRSLGPVASPTADASRTDFAGIASALPSRSSEVTEEHAWLYGK